MGENPEKTKKKFRINLFDVIFIACVLLAAVLFLMLSRRSDNAASILSTGKQETIVYTIELIEMNGDTAYLVRPGDTLIDKIEKRPMGTVVSVEVSRTQSLQKNFYTGERVMVEIPNKTNAVMVVTAEASITDSQISIGGFIVRVGTWVSVNGPLFNGAGYIIDMERSDRT